MEQTRNKDDAMRKNTILNTEKKGGFKKNFSKKKEREFCIWFDIKEKIRKRRKKRKKGRMRSRTKERRKMS